MNFKKLTFFFCVLVIGFTPLDALTISDNLTLGYVFFVLMSICAVLSGSLQYGVIILKPHYIE